VTATTPARQTKDFKFQLKGVEDTGSFIGLAAVYGNVDLGDDIIAPGAFTKTLREKGNQVPILWQHDPREPIGIGTLTDSEKGLKIEGQLCMESPVAQKAHALMKMGVLKGLSIGYDPVVTEWDDENEIRTLKEVKLWEVSTVTFPMNERANVTTVKASSREIEAAVETIRKAAEQLNTEIKAGRTLSASTVERLTSCMDAMKGAHACCAAGMQHIQSLMDPETSSGDKSADTHHDAGPDLHSSFDRLTQLLSR
jgi:HK97 family phage prohead protease